MALFREQRLKIYNSLSGKKEYFVPINEGRVGIYVCGPTVYNKVHLGNLRTFMSFDIVTRYLRHLGLNVRYVRNITDVGHLEHDADSGEDRISKKARLESLEPMQIVQRYTVDFHQMLNRLNCLPPDIEPSATGHIIEQIETVKDILSKGMAYVVNGSVYFDVFKYSDSHHYGILSGRNLEDLIHNSRSLDGQQDKKNPQDFALWKKAEPEHIMRWPSPWGDGFPGWHLECTTMSTKYLGAQFDIHGGGMDLKFPHHECEIAQSEACGNQQPVNYWMHANMLTLNGQKMAKSTGNNILPEEVFSGSNTFLSKAYNPSVVRFFMLQAHYRSVLDFSDAALAASEKGFVKLMASLSVLNQLPVSKITTSFNLNNWTNAGYHAMNDDFNTPVLIAELFTAVKFINQVKDGDAQISAEDKKALEIQLNHFIFDILGLESQASDSKTDRIDMVVKILMDLRNQARVDKDFALSDKIRDQLIEAGIQLNDGKDGTGFSFL